MNPEFWLDRWSRDQIGFHRTSVESYLEQNWAVLGIPDDSRVFVPLCGKSLDLLWLRDRGHEVLAVELSELAAEAFCRENGIPARRRITPEFDRYEAPRLTLLRGDFFNLSAAMVGSVAAVYDRAALVSWAPEARAAYVQHLTAITQRGTSIFLVSLEYPHAQMSGPPFSVEHDEIERLFSKDYSVKQLAKRDILALEPRMRDRGLTRLFDACYLLVRRN